MKLWVRIILVTGICMGLSACISDIWTGANVIYDRHHWYQKFADLRLATQVKRALNGDARLKCSECSIEATVFNRDILLVGYVPNHALRAVVDKHIRSLEDQRHYYNELALANEIKRSDFILDTWITAKIRSEIVADASIDPHQFKVVTSNRVVYLMGDVMPEQAEKVVMYAREWSEVKRVVKLFQYYQLKTPEPKPSSATTRPLASLASQSEPSSLEQTPG